MKKYFPQEIEPKWQERWDKSEIYKFDQKTLRQAQGKYYNLVEFPYTSGDLHLGHWFTFSPADAHARYKKMQGFSVFFPNGFDAFGLPAENAAIKRGIHPRDWTLGNIETMTKQFGTMGTMIDWKYKVITCLPSYYKWNQWIFIKMFEKGLAYRGKAFSNWCPSCQTVLANENIEAGHCWRCRNKVVQKEIEQWFLKITEYAEDLIWSDPTSPRLRGINWPKSVREGQNNWIGKSEGVVLKFQIVNKRSLRQSLSKEQIEVFTTRPETTDAATFVVLSPEVGERLLRLPHVANDARQSFSKKSSLTRSLSEIRQLSSKEKRKRSASSFSSFASGQSYRAKEIRKYIEEAKKKTEMERKEEKIKTGVFTGVYVKNPVTGEKIPVWIADYVLSTYGTGAIMAVPGEDERDREFAKKYNLPIVKSSLKAKPKGEKKVYYHLRDWSVSRQRYWGTPVPIIYCKTCALRDPSGQGIVPVPLKDLPVELPYEVDYAPKGKPPLATATDWIKVKCPKCQGAAQRDVETLDTFFDSSWYLWRYISPDYNNGPFDTKKTRDIMPVDVYFGGAEHTLGHTLYARFFTKFFKDLGLTNLSEFAKKRIQHGDILGPDGYRMSKSRGNVVSPDDLVKEYGADTVRTYLCFMMPYEATAPFSEGGISGVYRFLKRIWELQEKVSKGSKVSEVSSEDKIMMHKTIKKVTDDLENFRFNTAVASMMTWLNYLSRKKNIAAKEYETMLKLLAPFAPHITEELFTLLNSKFKIHPAVGGTKSIHLQPWPKYDEKFLKTDEVVIAVAVNGKFRATIEIESSKAKDQKEIESQALKLENVNKHLNGKKPKKVIYVEGRIINFVY